MLSTFSFISYPLPPAGISSDPPGNGRRWRMPAISNSTSPFHHHHPLIGRVHVILPVLAGGIDPHIATEAAPIPIAADLLDIQFPWGVRSFQ
jgi:hypothetical protein